MSNAAAQLDNTIEVVTPENIAFSYRAAGPFRRLPAYLLDIVFRLFIFLMLMWLVSLVESVVGAVAIAGLFIAWFLLSWFYGGVFEAYWNGQTPGKRIMGIRVLTSEGQPINGLQAVMRNILRFVDTFPLVSLEILDLPIRLITGEAAPPAYILPTFMFGLVSMTATLHFQRLGDLVCGTVVVLDQRQWFAGVAKLDDPRAAQLADYLPPDLQIGRSLSQTLAMYVDRRRHFTPARRREVARHLAEPLLIKFNLAPDTSCDLLLCAMYYRAFIADRGEDDVRDARLANRLQAAGTPFRPHSQPARAASSPSEPDTATSGAAASGDRAPPVAARRDAENGERSAGAEAAAAEGARSNSDSGSISSS